MTLSAPRFSLPPIGCAAKTRSFLSDHHAHFCFGVAPGMTTTDRSPPILTVCGLPAATANEPMSRPNGARASRLLGGRDLSALADLDVASWRALLEECRRPISRGDVRGLVDVLVTAAGVPAF